MEKINRQVTNRSSLSEVAKLFLKLGIIGFGGPAVHIALMQQEVVKKRAWMTEEHFLDLVGATNLIPGPNSTEMTMHIGHEQGGWRGLIVAGCCFIIPAVIITAFFAWLYQQYGQLPQVQPFIYGIKPAIIAVVVSLMIDLGRKALKNVALGIIGILAAIAVLAGFNEIYVLFGGGFLGMIMYLLKNSNRTANGLFPFVLLQIANPNTSLSDFKLFLTFLKIGSILYGSGYLLFAFLDAELVNKGLLTKQQLVDAIAVGQFTPGPVFFISNLYRMANWRCNRGSCSYYRHISSIFFICSITQPTYTTTKKVKDYERFPGHCKRGFHCHYIIGDC